MKTKKPLTISQLASGVELLGRYTLQLAMEQDRLSKRLSRLEKSIRQAWPLMKGTGK